MKSRSFEDAARQRSGLFCEKRVYLKSGDTTRFVRLGPWEQVLAWTGGIVLVTWTVAATSLFAVQYVQGNATREQAEEDRAVYETRVTALAAERDRRHKEAVAAQEQFGTLLSQLSTLQDRIFEAELAASEKTEEARTLQARLKTTQTALESATRQLTVATASEDTQTPAPSGIPNATLTVMTDALSDMSEEREKLAQELVNAQTEISDLQLTARLDAERTDRIFRKLEDAVAVTIEPLDDMFAKMGMDSETLLDTMRSRDSGGQGGPLIPIAMSTKGAADADTTRANNILSHMQELNLYRMAVSSVPMALPVSSNVRRTSGFGYRRDPIRGGTRLHAGVDWAGAYGTPVMSTADGVVTYAGWQSGYGRLVKVQHASGLETRYAHLSKLNVQKGQRVSRGDRIGAMGNSGRSTGTHLHYEVRLGGKATNPMTYITAAKDVF